MHRSQHHGQQQHFRIAALFVVQLVNRTNPMKETLAQIKAKLAKLESLDSQIKGLDTEKTELQAKVQTLTAQAAGGDAQAATSLTMAKARLDVLPNDVARNRAEYAAVVRELRNLLPAAVTGVAQAYGQEFSQVSAQVGEFLSSVMDEQHLVEEFTRQITNNSRTVKQLDGLRTVFQSPITLKSAPDNAIVFRAKSVVQHLANVR